MEAFSLFTNTPTWLLYLLLILFVWEFIWKLIAIWKAAQNKQMLWFICLALTNTIGMLPIIYILLSKKKE